MSTNTSRLFKRRLLVGSALVTVFLAGIIGIDRWGYYHRPMFHNKYGGDDRVPFRYWRVKPPHGDECSNAVIADYHLNLLVVFITGKSGINPVRFWFPHITERGATFPAQYGEDALDFFVPKVENVVIVFQSDGSREEKPLMPGEAKRLHEFLGPYSIDIPSLLNKAYSERHKRPLIAVPETPDITPKEG